MPMLTDLDAAAGALPPRTSPRRRSRVCRSCRQQGSIPLSNVTLLCLTMLRAASRPLFDLYSGTLDHLGPLGDLGPHERLDVLGCHVGRLARGGGDALLDGGVGERLL